MNNMNELKTQESHEYKRQLCLKKGREQRRARLVRETNEQRECRLERGRKAYRQRRLQTEPYEQSRRAKETSEETQKRLKPNDSEMPAEFSVKARNIELIGCMFKTKVSVQFLSIASHSFWLIPRNKLLCCCFCLGNVRRRDNETTEHRAQRLQARNAAYARRREERLLVSNNVATSDKSTCTAVAGLTLSNLLFTSKSGYRKKWQLFTCTRNLSSTGSVGFARKHGQLSARVRRITLGYNFWRHADRGRLSTRNPVKSVKSDFWGRKTMQRKVEINYLN